MLTGVRSLIEEKEKERKKGGMYVAKSPDVMKEGEVVVQKVTELGICWISTCTVSFTTRC